MERREKDASPATAHSTRCLGRCDRYPSPCTEGTNMGDCPRRRPPSSFGQVQFLLFLLSLLPLVPPLLPFPSPHILSSSTRRRIYPTSWQKGMEGVVGGWSALILLCRKKGHLVTLLPPPPPTTSSGATSLPPPAALCVIYEVGLVGGRVCVCVLLLRRRRGKRK